MAPPAPSGDGPTRGQAGGEPGTGPTTGQADMFGVPLPAPRVVERVDPLTLESDEIALLELLGPPGLVATPRAVKRLANSYGLLTAMRPSQRADDLAEQHATVADPDTGRSRQVSVWPYRAGMVLLAAVVAYPALGPALFVHLHRTASIHPQLPWMTLLQQLRPCLEQGSWRNAADTAMNATRAQQWQGLLEALEHAQLNTAAQGLSLPEPLSAWGQWVVPVGRLSFPTCRVVANLQRHRPLPR